MNPLQLRLVTVTSVYHVRSSVSIPHLHIARYATGEVPYNRTPEGIARFESMKKERYEDTAYNLVEADQMLDWNDSIVPPSIRGLLLHLRDGSFERYLRKLRRSKVKLDERSFGYMASAIPDIATLKRVERLLGLPISPRVMHNFFTAQSRARSITDSLRLCDEAQRGGFAMDWSIADPVIKRICNSVEPTAMDIEAAIRLYTDAKRTEETQIFSERENSLLRRHFTYAACSLVVRLSITGDNPRHIALAWEIAQRLRHANREPIEVIARAYVVAAMRQARTCEGTIAAYRKARSEIQCKLNSKDYRTVLATYMLAVAAEWDKFVPVFRGYFTILRDMVEDGARAIPAHYHPLFHHLRKAADVIMDIQDDMKREQLRQLFLDILHRIRTLFIDETIDKRSQVLLCQFMHIYARLSHFDGSLEVWDSIRKKGIPDNTTVSVFLDVCGFSREPDLALATKEKLESTGHALNGNNWLSLLECLCRCGRIGEATYQFIYHSPRGPDGQPDRLAAILLLGQALRKRQLLATRRLLRSHFPSLMIVQEGDSEFEKKLLTHHFDGKA